MIPRTLLLAVAAGLAGMSLYCCQLLEQVPPFQYLEAALVLSDGGKCHEVIGFHYGIRNLADSPISNLHLTFRLYDDSGSPLPAGNNVFDIAYTGEIAPRTECRICACLDTSFYFEPSGQLSLEEFRIYRVELSDGSSWRDPVGLFPYPYEVGLESGTGET